MRISEVIQHQPRLSGHQKAVNYLSKLGSLKNVGVSMTAIPKLGINPQSQGSNTPIGVYFYPADYYIEVNKTGEGLPMFSGQQYIQIFSYSGNVLDLDGNVSDTAYKPLWQAFTNFPIVPNQRANNLQNPIWRLWFCVKHGFNYRDYLDSSIEQVSKDGSNTLDQVSGSGFRELDQASTLWFVSWLAAKLLNPTSYIVTWNKLLRNIGYTTAITRTGNISYYEEVQGIVLDPRSIKMRQTIENKQPVATSPSLPNQLY
jgi:hypothetical protein